MNIVIEGNRKKKIQCNLTVPGDKSITHRAIILSAIAQGESRIKNFLNGMDCRNTLLCMRDLGVSIDETEHLLKISGKGFHGLKNPQEALDVGNSGTTIRLLSGLLSGQKFNSVLDGDKSIRKRPMQRVIQPLSQMNAKIKGVFHEDFAPLNITGNQKLRGIDYTLPVASAQVKSAILLAGLYANGETIIRERQVTRDHTERMLKLMQANILVSPDHKISLVPGKELKSIEIDIPGDISSAAYFLALGSAREDSEIIIKNVGTNPTRTGFLEVLRGMNADVKIVNQRVVSNEPRADISIKGTSLKGIRIDQRIIANIIDELPLVAVLATLAQGETIVKDARELRVKESDRIKAIVEGLSRMGANIIEREDGFEILGPTDLFGNEVNSYNDHRIAMSLAVAASHATGKTIIKGAECMNISYPDFMPAYQKIIH